MKNRFLKSAISMKMQFVLLLLFCVSLTSQADNKLLESIVKYEQLDKVLNFDKTWVDYPAYSDRAGWATRVDEQMAKLIIEKGEKALKHVWKPDLASDYLAFKRTGAILTGRENHLALQALTLAELVEGKGRFMDAIIDGTWFLCETSWIHSAHLHFQKDRSGLPDRDEPTVELVVSDIGAQMAWLHYFFKDEFDKVSPLIDKRIVEEVNRKLIQPYMERNDYWWMGFSGVAVNNWNPWINYNVLQAVMLVETDRTRIEQGVWKLIKSMDYFFGVYKKDGACEEGPTYWSHAFGHAVKFLNLLYKVTDGKVNVFPNPLLQNMARYIYRVHIGKNYFVNFADSSPKVSPSSSLLFLYGKRLNDRKMMEFAAQMADYNHSFKNGVTGYFAAALDELLMYKDIIACRKSEPNVGTYFFEDTQLCVARDKDGQGTGYYFAAKGGNNHESHNHNDVGTFILYYDSEPVMIDVGVETYTRQTFSDERYKIWTMQSGYHNLPTINGVEQKFGSKYKARGQRYEASSKRVLYQVDIAKAYPEEACVNKWERSYVLNRKKNFVISDSWNLSEVKGNTTLNFMTSCQVNIEDGNITLLRGKDAFQFNYDKKLFKAEIDNIELKDAKLIKEWGQDSLTRIRLVMQHPELNGESEVVVKLANR